MVGARAVVEGILNELKAGESDGAERHMVRSSGIQRRHGGRAKVGEGPKPFVDDRPRRFVSLQVDATDAAGAVVQVEVRRQRRVLRLPVGGRRIAEVLRDVSTRTEVVLLLTRPEADLDRPAWLQTQRLNQADGLHGHCAAGGVVGGPRGGMP